MTNKEMVENNSIVVFFFFFFNDPAWEVIISTLREHIPGFNVGYGKGNWMAFAIPNDMVEKAEEKENDTMDKNIKEIYDNAYEMYRNTDFCMMWDYLREQVNNGNINYGKAGEIAELVVSLYDSIGDTDKLELADLAEIAIQENWSDDEFYNTAIDMGYTPMDFDDCVTATLQMREHGLGYGDGYDFVNDLHQKYGLLEAFRMGNEYLEMQKYTEDKDEIEFCKEVVDALRKLDQI